MGPGTIIVGQTYDYNLLLGRCNQYGEYVQTYEVTDNTMKVRTVGALIMRPTGNVQGLFYYFSLATGRRPHRRCCTPLLISSTAIDKVHTMATEQKFPDRIEFLHANNTPITLLPVDDGTDDGYTESGEVGVIMMPIVLQVVIMLQP